jgi:ferredoxin-NADP reductase
MPTYHVQLLGRQEIARNTVAFIFQKPPDFNFTPGQYGNITLIDDPGIKAEDNTRSFSIASSPYVGDLMFAIRAVDTPFNRVLKELPLGAVVKLDAPYGSFVLHDKPTVPAVYLIGGVGIAPVRSIVLQATHDQSPQPILVFYSNYTPEDAAFLEELKTLEKTNPNFKLIATMTNMENSNSSWDGERGFIDRNMLAKYIRNLRTPIYYIAGSSSMVTAMLNMLSIANVSNDHIRTEEFVSR